MPNRARLKQPRAITLFDGALREAFPGVSVSLDSAEDPNGEWWIDFEWHDVSATVVWRRQHGFGLFTSEVGFGDRPDEIYKEAEQAVARLQQIYPHPGAPPPTCGLTLAEARHLRGTRQQALAEALESTQAAISRLENREDMKLSSLRAYLRAMGGELELRVHFDSFEAPLEVPRRDDDDG